MRSGRPAASSATTSRMALAPMSTTARPARAGGRPGRGAGGVSTAASWTRPLARPSGSGRDEAQSARPAAARAAPGRGSGRARPRRPALAAERGDAHLDRARPGRALEQRPPAAGAPHLEGGGRRRVQCSAHGDPPRAVTCSPRTTWRWLRSRASARRRSAGQRLAPSARASRGSAAKSGCLRFGGAAAVVARDVGEHLDLEGREAAQVAVLDQVVRVLVVARVGDVVARRRGAAPRTRAASARSSRQAVPRRVRVEERQRQLARPVRACGSSYWQRSARLTTLRRRTSG